ncbi:hypothetical protein FACS189432_07710 [Bacteroidia bacterium]|nr:hypothetical protein FACS189426_08850 [Bacteroidia bacterium]GHT29001.1 hypothetical protein FACS189432_07710 [Bacteroidia bacterium]
MPGMRFILFIHVNLNKRIIKYLKTDKGTKKPGCHSVFNRKIRIMQKKFFYKGEKWPKYDIYFLYLSPLFIKIKQDGK